MKAFVLVAVLATCHGFTPPSAASRRTFLKYGSAAALTTAVTNGSPSASALSNEPALNEVVPGQVTQPFKLDLNNSPVADYMRFPGMYPTIAGKIANNGPYKTVSDALGLPGLSSTEKATLKMYAAEFVVTPSNPLLDPMRGRDPYRTDQFSASRQIRQ